MSRKIAFIGGDSQVGTTMVAQAVAEEISSRRGRVLFVQASGKFGDDYFNNRDGRTIDGIRANLINGHLDKYELGQNLAEEGDLYILPAVKNYAAAASYTESVMEPLVQAASDFETVIFDCGDDMRSGLALSAAMVCSERYVVVTQQEKTLRRFRCLREQALDVLGLAGKLIINKYITDFSLLSEKEIERMLNMESAGKIPYIEYGWQAEIERKTLMGAMKFNRSVKDLTSVLLGEAVEERSWIRSLILRRS